MPSNALTIRLPREAAKLPDNTRYTNRFEIKSSSSNRVYIVAQEKHKRYWTCSCPGWIAHRNCKHLKALGLPCFEKPFEVNLISG